MAESTDGHTIYEKQKMIDTILTILGCCVYLPWFIQLAQTQWDKQSWSRQWLLLILSLQMVTTLHIPSVMYICVGLAAISLIVYLIHGRPSFRWTPIFIVSMAYVVWFAISILWSAIPLKGLQFLIDNGLPMLGFTTAACVLEIKKEELVQIFRTFCIAASIFVCLSLISWGISCAELHMFPWEWPVMRKELVGDIDCYKWIFRFLGGMATGYTHPSYNLLPVFIACGFATWLCHMRHASVSLWWIIWVGGTLVTILAQSRMGVIYSAILLVGYILYHIPNRQKRIIVAASLMVAGTIAGSLTIDFWRQYGDDPIRATLNTNTWKYIQAKPWTGAGAGALNPIEICHTIGEIYWPHVGYIDPARDVADWPEKAHMLPHNQWLAEWSHGGLLAALLSLALYITFAVLCVRKKCYWGKIAWLIFVIFSFLEPMLYIGKGLYLFCMLALFLQATTECKE